MFPLIFHGANVMAGADGSIPILSTAEVAANSPRFRRKSTPFVDAIHDLPEKLEMAPAQLYSTESGRLFHSGRIAIATVGLPARGKTYVNTARLESPLPERLKTRCITRVGFMADVESTVIYLSLWHDI